MDYLNLIAQAEGAGMQTATDNRTGSGIAGAGGRGDMVSLNGGEINYKVNREMGLDGRPSRDPYAFGGGFCVELGAVVIEILHARWKTEGLFCLYLI